MLLRSVLAVAVGIALGSACGPAGVFECQADEDCVAAGIGGTCQPDGFCSFPSDDCDSGQQYGQYASPELAGTCVPLGGDSSSDGTSPGSSGTLPPDTGDASTADGDTGVEPTTGPEPTTGNPPPPDDGLLLWLTFDEAEDAVVLDHSGNDFHAQCLGPCPLITDGIHGDSMLFSEGTSLLVPYQPDFATPDALTIAMWARPERLQGPAMALAELPFLAEADPNWNSWELRLADPQGGDVPHSLFFATANTRVQNVVALPDLPFSEGQWVHVAGVWDGERVRLYVDGVENTNVSATPPQFDGQDIYVGSGASEGMLDDWYDGNLDELRLYGRALDSEEVATLAQGSP